MKNNTLSSYLVNFLEKQSSAFRSIADYQKAEILKELIGSSPLKKYISKLNPFLNLPDHEIIFCQFKNNSSGYSDDSPILFLEENSKALHFIAKTSVEFIGMVPYDFDLLINIQKYCRKKENASVTEKIEKTVVSSKNSRLYLALSNELLMPLNIKPVTDPFNTIKKISKEHFI